MLVLSATRTPERGKRLVADYERAATAVGVLKWQIRVERPDQAVDAIRRALHETVSGKPGVAQVDLPIDVSTGDLDAGSPPVPAPRVAPMFRPLADPITVDDTAGLLRNAARPVLLVGGGAIILALNGC